MILYKLAKYISLMMDVIPSLCIWGGKNFQKLSELISQDNNSLVIDILHAMKFTQTKNLWLMEEYSQSKVLINSHWIITDRGTIETSV